MTISCYKNRPTETWEDDTVHTESLPVAASLGEKMGPAVGCLKAAHGIKWDDASEVFLTQIHSVSFSHSTALRVPVNRGAITHSPNLLFSQDKHLCFLFLFWVGLRMTESVNPQHLCCCLQLSNLSLHFDGGDGDWSQYYRLENSRVWGGLVLYLNLISVIHRPQVPVDLCWANRVSCTPPFVLLKHPHSVFWEGIAAYPYRNLCQTLSGDLAARLSLFSLLAAQAENMESFFTWVFSSEWEFFVLFCFGISWVPGTE